MGACTVAHMCTACHLMPKDDIVWFLARNDSGRSTVRKSYGTSIHCAVCGSQSKVKDMSYEVSMQYGNSLDLSGQHRAPITR